MKLLPGQPRAGTSPARAHLTQWAAQFAVASELCKRGYDVGFTMGHNTPLADLFVIAPESQTTCLVDVKGQSTRSFWRIKDKSDRKDLFYILAYVPKDGENRFFVMHQRDLKLEMEKYRNSGIKFDERFSGMNWGSAYSYEGKWDSLPV